MSSPKNLNIVSHRIGPGTLSAYLLAPVFVAIAVAPCLAIAPLPAGVPLALLFLAVIATAMVCGIGAGFFSLAISLPCAWYFDPGPGFSFRWDSIYRAYDLGLLAIAASVMILAIGFTRKAVARFRGGIQSLKEVFEAHPDAILLTDARGRITDANPRVADMFGKPKLALIGTPVEALFPSRLGARVALLLASPKAEFKDLLALRIDASEFPVDVLIASVTTDGLVQTVVTIREREAFGQALADSRQQRTGFENRPFGDGEARVWADAFTHAAVGLTITDPKSRSLRFVNKVWAEMHGWEPHEVAGMPTSMFFPEDEMPRVASLYAEADRTGHVTFDVRRRRKDGSTFLAAFDVVTVHDAKGHPLYRVATSRDITASKQAEEVLRHATKMEAIGGLTGGMAHDFNNLLGAIILSLDFVQTEMADTDHLKPFVLEAKSAAESGADLIRNLLAFARRQALHPTRIDVNEQVSGMHRLLSRVLGEEIAIVLKTAPDLWPVIADRSQLETCLFNLATNARDAMPRGGSLTIATSNQNLDDDYARQNPSVTPGDYVMIAVSDTGTGMTPDIMAKIFEPFFTTKPPGKGTGLGLSTVYGIVQQYGGQISVESQPGEGTTFRIYFPRANAAAPGPIAGAAGQAFRGTETILVAEDDELVRPLVCKILEDSGYRVMSARTGELACDLVRQANVPVALLVTDVAMPGMSGYDLAQKLKLAQAGVKVLFISGNDENAEALGGAFLKKPFTPDGLSSTVRTILGATE